MGADNWKECPKCEEKFAEDIANYEEQLRAKGLTNVEVQLLVEKRTTVETYTLREDYEIYSEDFIVYVTYSCHCTKCGFSASMEFEQSMKS